MRVITWTIILYISLSGWLLGASDREALSNPANIGFDVGVTWNTGPALRQIGPSCVGFAWAQWLTVYKRGAYNPSGLGLYHLAQTLDDVPGEDYDGTTTAAGAEALKLLGLLHSYSSTINTGIITSFLEHKGPVVIQSEWLYGMDRPDANGYVHIIGRALALHAYVCSNFVRYGRYALSVGCVNSWGDNWGVHGRFRITVRDLKQLMLKENAAAFLAAP